MEAGRKSILRWSLIAALAAAVSLPVSAQAQTKLTPKEILDHVDDLFRGDSSHGKATMTVTTEHWTRSLSMEFWSKGKDDSLIRITAPKKEEGTATLRSGNDVWNYLPKVNRVIKLPSSMMGASWMGSHFTNDDLVKESRMTQDYDFKVVFDGERDGRKIIEVECHPKPDAAVVWGKVTVAVRQQDYLPLEVSYFDEDQKLARTITYSDIQKMAGKDIPLKLTAIPADKPQESTVVLYHEIRFDVPLAADLFSIRTLQR